MVWIIVEISWYAKKAATVEMSNGKEFPSESEN